MFIFPDRENKENWSKDIESMFLHRDFTSNTGTFLMFKNYSMFHGCSGLFLWLLGFCSKILRQGTSQ